MKVTVMTGMSLHTACSVVSETISMASPLECVTSDPWTVVHPRNSLPAIEGVESTVTSDPTRCLVVSVPYPES